MNTTCILFDLDGTLVDTAPDLGYALNMVLAEEGHKAISAERIRPFASKGGRGLLKLGFDIDEDHEEYGRLRERFLEIYEENLCRESRLFDGMHEALDSITDRGLTWGVVTNKPSWLANPLMEQIQLPSRPVCVVGADQVPRPKPDPAALELACELSGHASDQCVYVGDAKRDIVAGRRAGMRTIAVRYGYIGEGDSADDWGADWVIDTPAGMLDCLIAEAA